MLSSVSVYQVIGIRIPIFIFLQDELVSYNLYLKNMKKDT